MTTLKLDIHPKQRKPYLKPILERIRLAPEEAVLGGCKTASIGGPGSGPGEFCTDTACNTIAS